MKWQIGMILGLLSVSLLWAKGEPPKELDKKGPTVKLIIWNPGGAGSYEEAKDVMATFSKILSRLAGQKVEVVYYADFQKGKSWIEKHRPQLLLLPPTCFWEYQQKWKLTPQLCVQKKGLREVNYHILVAKDSAYTKFGELQGKNLWSHHTLSRPWLECLFQEQWKGNLIIYPRYLRAIRKLVQNKPLRSKSVDAVLIDSLEWQSLRQSPSFSKKYVQKVRILATSLPVPIMILASRKKVSPSLLQAFASLQKDPEGKKLLALFGMDHFSPPPKGWFDKWKKLCTIYRKKCGH